MRRTRAGASPRKTRGGKVAPKKKLGAGNLPRIAKAKQITPGGFSKALKAVAKRNAAKPKPGKTMVVPKRKPLTPIKPKVKKPRGGVSKRRMTQSRRKTR